MKDFLRREDGVVAVIFAVMAIPFIAMGGWAVDYLRLQHVHDTLQQQVDASALTALLEDMEWETVEAMAESEIGQTYGGSWANEIDFSGSWIIEGAEFRVTAEAEVPLAFIKILPGIGDTQMVRVSAVAQLVTPQRRYQAPTFTSLSFEAADFNRLWLYCYWPNRPANDPDLPKRTLMVPIADNGGSTFELDPGEPPNLNEYPILDAMLAQQYQEMLVNGETLDTSEDGIWRQVSGGTGGDRTYRYVMPQCQNDSYLSIRLENVRDSRTTPSRWDTGGNRFNYYTETEQEEGEADTYHGLKAPNGQDVTILETILCDTEHECTNTAANGGLIPRNNHTNRTPAQAEKGCSENGDQYMYYGWEDRPPEIASSDRDYDDIRIVMACPSVEYVGDRNARLVL